MTEISFNQSADVTAKLKTLDDAFAGQLINMAIGNDKLEQMFAQDPSFQKEQFEGKPTMVIAKELGIITPDVSDALLILQAGVRTYNNAVSAKVALTGQEVTTRKIDEYSLDFMNEEKFDPRFRALKFGGSPQLVSAQASYAISQTVLNKSAEIGYYSKQENDLGDESEPEHLKNLIANKLRNLNIDIDICAKHGGILIKTAIAVLETKTDLIKPEFLAEIKGLVGAITPHNYDDIEGTPHGIAKNEIHKIEEHDMHMVRVGMPDSVPDPVLMEFLKERTSTQNPNALAPENSPKAKF